MDDCKFEMEVMILHLKVMVSAWKAWLVRKDVTADCARNANGVFILRVVETQVLITFVCCGEVGNVVCMDGICRFVDVAEIRGGPPIWIM